MDRQPDGSATLTFTKPLTADDVIWQLQTGTDLSGWQPATASLLQRTAINGSETFTFSIPQEEFNETRRYWRVRFDLR